MIHTFVVHVAANDLTDGLLVGVVEDVWTAERHNFRSADELVGLLRAGSAGRARDRGAHPDDPPDRTPVA